MGKIILILLGCALLEAWASAPAQATDIQGIPQARWAEVAQTPAWHRLMHYYRYVPFGILKSEVGGPEYFFAPQGRRDPEAELRASAEAFAGTREVGSLHQPAQCAYPERFRFVKKELGLSYTEVPCPLLDRFLAQFDADSLTLVFSGAQQDSPATMFGHTFFRINSRKKGQSELLDQGLSYAAVAPPDDGPLVFYFLGMTGGYHGHFSALPYYLKVHEYTNSDSRDLWEYKLSLTREQTLMVLRHAWEIETNSWLSYYFFDGNCASALLELLEVARPDWDLTPFSLYVIPSEAVKRVVRIPGAVTEVSYRPSLKKKLEGKISLLSADDRRVFYSIIHGAQDPAAVRSAGALDAAATYYVFEKEKMNGKLPPELYFRMRQVLAQRSTLPAAGESESELKSGLKLKLKLEDETPHSPSNRPDIGHDAIQASLGGGIARYGEGRGSPTLFQELNMRSAYHDLMNDDEGFARFSQIEFPSLSLRYYPQPKTLEIDRLNLLSIISLFPISKIEFKPSWQLAIEYFAPKDASCDDCHAFHFQAGTGLTTELFTPSALGSVMVVGDFQAGNWQRLDQDRWFRAGPGIQGSVLANPWRGYKTRWVATTLTDLLPTDAPGRSRVRYELEWEHSVKLGTQWDTRLSWTAVFQGSGNSTTCPRAYYDETLLSLNHYF